MQYQNALLHIRKENHGLLVDLYKVIDSQLVDRFGLLGLIHRGVEFDGQESWKVTKKGKQIHNLVEMYESSLLTKMEKLQGFFNQLIFSKHIQLPV